MSKYAGKIVTNQAPAGYSVFFDGSGDSLTLPNNAAFAMGTGAFTIEFWFNTSSIAQTGYIIQTDVASTSLYISFSSSTIRLTDQSTVYVSTPTLLANTWYHIAVVRSGTGSNQTVIYTNGVAGTAGTCAQNFTQLSPAVGANNYLGYISNLRIVKGTALYTTAFTPPTQLLNVTNTSILTCNSPAIVDQSSNAFAITTNGDARVSTFTPFPAYNVYPTSANPLTPAPGVWTLDEAMQLTQQGVWPSYPANAIEDVFSTYLYTGTGATQTITNGVNLSGQGGLVWTKARSIAFGHALFDTSTGVNNYLATNSTSGTTALSNSLTSFNSNGFTIGSAAQVSDNASTFASWTFREQAKFFDVVTYTGNGSNRTIAHNLGSVPGCIIIKRTDTVADWQVYHRSLANTEYLVLNTTAAKATGTTRWNSTTPTSTEFSLGTDTTVNANSGTYVAYLFAHDAGGFGAAGTDNVISCGSYTGNGSATGPTVTLGYEPQWILIKRTDVANGWIIHDVMRGLPTGGNSLYLQANVTDAEAGPANYVDVNATGFQLKNVGNAWNASGGTYIYIAIRRGPMRPPLTSTSVFTPIKTGSGSTLSDSYASIGFPIDMTLRYQTGTNTGATYKNAVFTRLLGINSGATDTPTSTNAQKLLTPATDAAVTSAIYYSQTGSMGLNYGGSWNAPDYVLTHLHFRRAPGFFDVVCYTGTGSNRTVSHNLTVAPELMIVKRRDTTGNWQVYSAYLPSAAYILALNSTSGQASSGFDTVWNSTAPTASVFTVGTSTTTNASGGTYVAYLFATVGGVSKVGSYTGTGTTQQINCGFTNGSRFVMIKRTDTTGDWYVWDSARGIVAGNDPYLLLNSTAAEVTGTDYVDTYSAGFELSSTAPAALNASGGTYIFYAIA